MQYRRLLVALATAATVGTTLAGVSAAQEPGTDPSGSPSTIVVAPSTGLADNQLVQVEVTGFPPGDLNLDVSQCSTETYDPDTCVSLAGDSVGDDGTAGGPVRVTRFLHFAGVDCAVDPCWMVATAPHPVTPTTASTPISFDPTAPPVPPSPPFEVDLTIDTSVPFVIGPDGSVKVTGTLTCGQATELWVQVQILQGEAIGADDTAITRVGCGPTPVGWSVSVDQSAVGEPPFFPGPAVVRALAATIDDFSFAGFTGDLSVNLVAAAPDPVVVVPAFTG